MALLDWTAYIDGGADESDPQGFVLTDTINPIFGSGSVAFSHNPSTEFQSMNLVPALTPTGYPYGRLQTLLRFTSGNPASEAFINYAGILCMQNVENLAQFGTFGGTGHAYGIAVMVQNFTTSNIVLFKFTEGLDGIADDLSNYIVVSTELPFSVGSNAVVGLEVTWAADATSVAQHDGVAITVKVGQESDFSDLAQVMSHVDGSIDPFLTTVAESLWVGMRLSDAGTPNTISFDQTYFYRTATN